MEKLRKIEYFPIGDMRKISALLVGKMKERIFERGFDKDGKRFKKYSQSYIDLLEDEKRLRAQSNLRGFSLEVGPKKIATRNPRLTGRTARDLRPIRRLIRKDNLAVGWESDQADIVVKLEEMGRDFVNDLPKQEKQWLVRKLGESWDKQIRQVKNKIINVG